MHRLGVYRIRLPKQIFLRTPGSRSLRCAVTEGGGDGEGRFTRFVSRTLINQSYDCQRIYSRIKNTAYNDKFPMIGTLVAIERLITAYSDKFSIALCDVTH